MDVAIVIKTWVNKALILAYVTLFCFLGISTKVHAEKLFILDNMITNGNFRIDSNSDGLGDNWGTINSSYKKIENNYQYAYSDASTYFNVIYQYLSWNIDHKYYISIDMKTNISVLKYFFCNINLNGTNRSIFSKETTNTEYKHSMIWENTYQTKLSEIKFYLSTTSGKLTINDYLAISNVVVIDLTSIFGWGSEPTLQDFELYYLPDLDYFDTYNSFEPEMTTSISDISYSNLNENLKVIDYTKSIIDNDGRNIDLDLSLYFYDINTIPGYVQAYYYKENNHPTMKYNGVEYVLNWVYSDYSQRVLILDLTDEEELILKKILFNRYIDRGEEYFNFKAEMSYTTAKMWFTIGSKFDLLVDVKSFLLSRETITENDFNIVNEMYIKTYDQSDNLLLPSLKLDISDLFRTIYVGDFGSKYTNISKFNFEFLLVSPTVSDTYQEENHYFYEIGIFSSDKVLHPSAIESDIDSLWDMKTCDWYQIGCHLSNFANDVLTTTYNRMNIDAIIAFFDGIIDDVTQVVDTVPSGVKTVFTVLFAGLGVALIIVIIEKMNR